jgi:hypothetical protein
MMKNINLSFILITILSLVSCTKKELNRTERKLTGTWVEVRQNTVSESFTFYPNHKFKKPSLSDVHSSPFTPVEWEANDKNLSLTYRLNKFSLLGYILPNHRARYQIKELTDSSAVLYSMATKKGAASSIILRRSATKAEQ